MQYNLLPIWNGYSREATPNLYWNNDVNSIQMKIIVRLIDPNGLAIRTFNSVLTADNNFIVDTRTGVAAVDETPNEFKMGEYDYLVSLFGTFDNPSSASLFSIIGAYLDRNEAKIVPQEFLGVAI